MGLKVCATPCGQCLFSKDRIVSASRVREILKDCARNDNHFQCHKGTIAGKDVVCRTFYDTRTSKMIRFAQWLGTVEFVNHDGSKIPAESALNVPRVRGQDDPKEQDHG